MWKMKKCPFCKNCLTLFLWGREKKTHFRALDLFWPKILGGPKQWKPGKTIKNSGFSGNCPTRKMTLFWERWFWGWVKKCFSLTVFLKSCALLKTHFYRVFSKHSNCNRKDVCLKQTENVWKTVGCFEHGNKMFLFVFFWGFNGFVCVCVFFFGGGRVLRVRWGGPKGHLTWPLLFLVLFSFCFFVLFLFRKSVFPWRRGYFCACFSVSLCFSLACLTSPFHIHTHTHSLPLSLSIFLLSSFLVFFVSSFLFFFLGVFLCFCFMQRTTSNIKFEGLFSSIFLGFLVSCFALSFRSHFLIFNFSFGPPHLTLPFFGVFVSLVVVFLFCVGFVFVVFALFLFVLSLDCFRFVCFMCLLCFYVFVLFLLVIVCFVCFVCMCWSVFVMFCFSCCVFWGCAFVLFFVFVGVV